MIILSHRGYWKDDQEKNSAIAFERSFSNGFGTETDVRDFNGRLVISHDPASSECMLLEAFFELYLRYPCHPTLALNVKSDGLQVLLQRQLASYGIKNYFVFDMAVPDGLLYLRSGLVTFTRQSEFEADPAYYDFASGVWLDEFDGHWVSDAVIENHLARGKSLCIVSPELHNRSYEAEWMHYRKLERKIGKDRLMLCTDFPEHAKDYFNATTVRSIS
jgi:glycerophosphoryl diester phosphodiesterase